MVVLPPIKGTKNRRSKKPPLKYIPSLIFKNGLTWFDLDSVTDPFNLTWHKYIPLNQQVEEYIHSKKELADRRILRPVKNEFDEAKLVGYYEDISLQTKKNIQGRLLEIENHEKSLKKAWEVLEHNELEFKASVAAYDKFIAINKNKREVSHRKLAYFKSRTKTLRKKIRLLNIYIDILQKVIVEMRENYKKHRMYYVFCSEVAHADGSKSPLAVLDRYVAIKGIEEFIYKKLFRMTEKYTSTYNKLKKMETEKHGMVDSLIIQLNELKIRYEEASRRVLKSQQIYNTVREKCHIQMKCAQSTIEGISALYESIQSRKSDSSHIPRKRKFERILYIGSKIDVLEKIRTSKNVQDDQLQKEEVESADSGFVVHLKYNSVVFRSSSDELNENTFSLKEESIHSSSAERVDSQKSADSSYKKQDILNTEDETRNLFHKTTSLPKRNLQNDRVESKKATFRASLVSFKSTTRSSVKLPDIRMSTENKSSENTDESKEKQPSSYEKRKIFDKERKLSEDKKKSLLKNVRSTQREARKKRLKHQSMGVENDESFQLNFEF